LLGAVEEVEVAEAVRLLDGVRLGEVDGDKDALRLTEAVTLRLGVSDALVEGLLELVKLDVAATDDEMLSDADPVAVRVAEFDPLGELLLEPVSVWEPLALELTELDATTDELILALAEALTEKLPLDVLEGLLDAVELAEKVA
jgi:hypothetical protein